MRDASLTQFPPVVCLHGSGATSGMWQDLRTAARGRCRVLTPQLDGHSLAEDAASVIEQVGCDREPFHIVAHARGAAVAACMAARCPGQVLSIIAYEPAGITRALERGLTMPLRLLCGTRSWSAARQLAESLSRSVASAQLLKLVGLRHMAPLTHPNFVNAVILDYLLPTDMPGQVLAA